MIGLWPSSQGRLALQLEAATAQLTQSLADELWQDEAHLKVERGGRMWLIEAGTVVKLYQIAKLRQDEIPSAVLANWQNRLNKSDRLLAASEIEMAASIGGSTEQLSRAFKELYAGDLATTERRFFSACVYYR